jgi:hypothetical protein
VIGIRDKCVRLLEPPVDPPCLSGLDPTNRRRGNALLQKPDAGIQCGLAGADDDEAIGLRGEMRDVAGRHAANAVGQLEGRWTRRGHRTLEISGVDDLPPHGHSPRCISKPRDNAVVAHILAIGEIANTPAGQEVSMHHVREVGADLVSAGELVVPGVCSGDVDDVVTERRRVDTVESGRLMQTNERICVDPMPAGSVASIDDRHRRVGMLE